MLKTTEKQSRSLLAQNISNRRKAKKWNQAELAHQVGVHLNTIKSIETDKSEGEFQTRKAIADSLGCSLSDLYSEIVDADKHLPIKHRVTVPTLAELEEIVQHPERFDPLYLAHILAQQFLQVHEPARAVAASFLFAQKQLAIPYVRLLQDFVPKQTRKGS